MQRTAAIPTTSQPTQAVSQPAATTRPATPTQQPTTTPAAPAATPTPAPAYGGNVTPTTYQQDRQKELYQGGMDPARAAAQSKADSARMDAAWKKAPKVDPSKLSVWAKDANGKYGMVQTGSATYPAIADKTPSGITPAEPAKPAAPAPAAAPAKPNAMVAAWKKPMAVTPTPQRTAGIASVAGYPRPAAPAPAATASRPATAAPAPTGGKPKKTAIARTTMPPAPSSSPWGRPAQGPAASIAGPAATVSRAWQAVTNPETADRVEGKAVFNGRTKVGNVATGDPNKDLPLDQRPVSRNRMRLRQALLAKK